MNEVKFQLDVENFTETVIAAVYTVPGTDLEVRQPIVRLTEPKLTVHLIGTNGTSYGTALIEPDTDQADIDALVQTQMNAMKDHFDRLHKEYSKSGCSDADRQFSAVLDWVSPYQET